MASFPREEISYKKLYKNLDIEKALGIEWPEVFCPTDVAEVDEDQETFVEEQRFSLDEYDENFCISKEIDEELFAKVFQLLDRNFLSYIFKRINSLKYIRGKLPCDVCGRLEAKGEQLLLTCQGCGINVHEECYGVVEAPGRAWLCKKCIFHFEDGRCKLCQRQDGVMKRTNTNEWIHVICALLTPDISFCNNNIRDPVDISELVVMEGTCSICCSLGHSLIRCSFDGCQAAYHASCGAELLYCDLANKLTYCTAHDPLKKHIRILSRRSMLKHADSYAEMSETALLRTPAKIAAPIKTEYHRIVHTKPFVIEDDIEQFKTNKASVNAIKRYWTKKRKALGFYFDDIFIFSNCLLSQNKPSMLEDEKAKLRKCYRYKNYETAIFLCSYLAGLGTEYTLLKGILLYENGEYSRSIFHLSSLQSTTAVFYMALNYRKMRKYSEAIICLSHINEHKTTDDHVSDSFIQSFVLDSKDTEFFDSLLGELLILKGKSRAGTEKYKNSLLKNPLIGPIYGLFDENIWISPIDSPSDDVSMSLYQNLFKASIQKSKSHPGSGDKIPKTILEASMRHPEYTQYLSLIQGIGSYFVSKIASIHCRFGEPKLGNQLFEILRDKDPFFISDLDVYSTSLWIARDENMLGLLAKDLIASHPTHYVTWSVIGNYYSLRGMAKESTTCLMKSLSIQENPFAYSLLGFEYNSRSQFLEAQGYFKSSICMLENNDKAYFGLGIALNEMFKKQTAEVYFMKALALNHRCMSMKAYLVRFYVKNNEVEKAMEKIREYLGIHTDDLPEVAGFIEANFGKFSEIEELIICELAEVMVKMKHKDLARKIIDCVQCRTSSYFCKRSIIENDA